MVEDVDILPHAALKDLKNPTKRQKSERHMKANGDRRRTPIPLSGSTAKLDDFMYLRAIVKNDISNSDALELLIRSGYTDEEAWEKALRRLGLRTDETPRDFKVIAYEGGESDASRSTQDFRSTSNSTLSAGGIFTPTRPVDEAFCYLHAQCSYYTRHLPKMKEHVSSTHKVKAAEHKTSPLWRECTL
jgi:hypothetical protein